FEEALKTGEKDVRANIAVPQYFKLYEKNFGLQVFRPVKVEKVYLKEDRFFIDTSSTAFSALGIINATGTWESPYIPEYPGAALFEGEHLHTRDFKVAAYFKGKHVLIVGAGISAIQLLDQISQVTSTTWVTRRPPEFSKVPFDERAGSRAVAMVDERV